MPKKRSYEWLVMKEGMIDSNTPRQCKDCKRVLPISAFSVNGNGYYESQCKECKSIKEKARYQSNRKGLTDKYWRKRLQAIQQNAIKRGLSFYITIDDLKRVYVAQKGQCYYTGLPLVIGSVDRIDVERGYYPDNIIMCERYVNVFRGDMSRTDFIALCTRIAAHHIS
jgi:hypothetical protein